MRFSGEEIGRVDDNGHSIRCGDRVKLTVHKKGYVQRSTQDGWGRDVRLDRADWRHITDQSSEFVGTVIFDEKRSAFQVSWDGGPKIRGENEIGPPSEDLYMVGKSVNHPDDRLEVLDT